MIRVMLVEDHNLTRRGTRILLESVGDMEIIGETGRGEEALALARRLKPDVVLLDIRLEGLGGIDVARALREELPQTRIVALSAYPYETYVRALLAVGVHGYLLKNVTDDKLLDAIRAVHQGNTVLSSELGVRLKSNRFGRVFGGELSEREMQVLMLVGQGESNKEIARALEIGERTVESYLANAMAKLGARSRRMPSSSRSNGAS